MQEDKESFAPRPIYAEDEQRTMLEQQRAAWKIFMNSCEANNIDAIQLSNILGISQATAMQYFKEGAVPLHLDDEQLLRFARATGKTAHFWKSLLR